MLGILGPLTLGKKLYKMAILYIGLVWLIICNWKDRKGKIWPQIVKNCQKLEANLRRVPEPPAGPEGPSLPLVLPSDAHYLMNHL